MPNYAPIPEFGQLVEYITQAAPIEQDGEIYYGLEFHHSPITRHEITDLLTLRAVLEDYVHVFRILVRVLDSELSELNIVIPAGIRTRINAWLTSRGYPTIPTRTTYKQFLVAVRNRVRG
jgi:hypothetical protein